MLGNVHDIVIFQSTQPGQDFQILTLRLRMMCFRTVNSTEYTLNCRYVDVGVDTYTKDMAIAWNFKFNVANTKRIAAAANSVFMVIYKFVAGNADARKCLEEAVNRAITAPSKRVSVVPSISRSSVKRC